MNSLIHYSILRLKMYFSDMYLDEMAKRSASFQSQNKSDRPYLDFVKNTQSHF